MSNENIMFGLIGTIFVCGLVAWAVLHVAVEYLDVKLKQVQQGLAELEIQELKTIDMFDQLAKRLAAAENDLKLQVNYTKAVMLVGEQNSKGIFALENGLQNVVDTLHAHLKSVPSMPGVLEDISGMANSAGTSENEIGGKTANAPIQDFAEDDMPIIYLMETPKEEVQDSSIPVDEIITKDDQGNSHYKMDTTYTQVHITAGMNLKLNLTLIGQPGIVWPVNAKVVEPGPAIYHFHVVVPMDWMEKEYPVQPEDIQGFLNCFMEMDKVPDKFIAKYSESYDGKLKAYTLVFSYTLKKYQDAVEEIALKQKKIEEAPKEISKASKSAVSVEFTKMIYETFKKAGKPTALVKNKNIQ